MSANPWMDPREIDDLAARYPTLPRTHVEDTFEAYWPWKDDVEQALRELVAMQLPAGSPEFSPSH